MEDKYQQIIQEIENKINTNGNKEITGAILQGVLLGIIAAVQANLQGKLVYYNEDVDNGNAQITGELLNSLRVVVPEGMTVYTSNFRFLFEDGGLEIRNNGGTAVLQFDTYALDSNLPINVNGYPLVSEENIYIKLGFQSFKSGNYLADEYCVYEGKLYQFTENHNGDWTGNDVEETNLVNILNDHF